MNSYKFSPIMIQEILSHRYFVVFDIETTGFSLAKHAELLEIGAVKIDVQDRKVIGSFHTLIQPAKQTKISPRITELTSIKTEMIQDKPYSEPVLLEFAQFIGSTPVIAHNARFDWKNWMVPELERVGIRASNPAFCTMELSKYLHKNWTSHKLEALCAYYGQEIQGHHRAFTDAKYTASAFLKMREELCSQTNDLMFKNDVQDYETSQFLNLGHPVRIYRVTGSELSGKRGYGIYIATDAASLCYSVKRQVWYVTKLRTDKSIHLQSYVEQVLDSLGMTIGELCRTYTAA